MAEIHSRVEPFLLLARSTRGSAAAKVVLDATAANGVYVFSDLMALPNIQELASDPTYEKHHRLLQLFAYGTLSEYTASPDSYPPLTPAHQAKLKHLTLVSLALQSRSLPYADLSRALQVSTTRELENLIIDVTYADLLGGKMYHHEEMFHVDWASGRDVSKDGLVKVQAGLQTWCKNAQTLLAALDDQIATVRDKTIRDAEDEAKYARMRDDAFLEASKAGKKANKFGGDGSWVDYMEMDDGDASDTPMLFEPRVRSSSQRSVEALVDEVGTQRAKKRAKD